MPQVVARPAVPHRREGCAVDHPARSLAVAPELELCAFGAGCHEENRRLHAARGRGFKSLVGAATVDLLVISDADAAMSYRLLALLVLPTTAGWLLALALLLRPIERWARAGADASDSQIIAAAIAAH